MSKATIQKTQTKPRCTCSPDCQIPASTDAKLTEYGTREHDCFCPSFTNCGGSYRCPQTGDKICSHMHHLRRKTAAAKSNQPPAGMIDNPAYSEWLFDHFTDKPLGAEPPKYIADPSASASPVVKAADIIGEWKEIKGGAKVYSIDLEASRKARAEAIEKQQALIAQADAAMAIKADGTLETTPLALQYAAQAVGSEAFVGSMTAEEVALANAPEPVAFVPTVSIGATSCDCPHKGPDACVHLKAEWALLEAEKAQAETQEWIWGSDSRDRAEEAALEAWCKAERLREEAGEYVARKTVGSAESRPVDVVTGATERGTCSPDPDAVDRCDKEAAFADAFTPDDTEIAELEREAEVQAAQAEEGPTAAGIEAAAADRHFADALGEPESPRYVSIHDWLDQRAPSGLDLALDEVAGKHVAIQSALDALPRSLGPLEQLLTAIRPQLDGRPTRTVAR